MFFSYGNIYSRGYGITESVSRLLMAWSIAVSFDGWFSATIVSAAPAIARGYNSLESKTRETGNHAARQQAEAVVHLASGGNDYSSLRLCGVQEVAASARRAPERKNSRCSAKSWRTRLSHDIYFAERLVCKTPRKSPYRWRGTRFAGTCPRSAFRLFGAPLSSDMHMHAVTINIFIARGMGRTRGIQRGRFATPKTYNLYLYVRYTNVCCRTAVNQEYCRVT